MRVHDIIHRVVYYSNINIFVCSVAITGHQTRLYYASVFREKAGVSTTSASLPPPSLYCFPALPTRAPLSTASLLCLPEPLSLLLPCSAYQSPSLYCFPALPTRVVVGNLGNSHSRTACRKYGWGGGANRNFTRCRGSKGVCGMLTLQKYR